MSSCNSCRYLFVDKSVDYYECTKSDCFSDDEYVEIALDGCGENCPYYAEDHCFDLLDWEE